MTEDKATPARNEALEKKTGTPSDNAAAGPKAEHGPATPNSAQAAKDAAQSAQAQSAQAQNAQAQNARVQFDTTTLKSSYCNVCNGSSTREEVVLNFGLNTTWDRSGDDRLQVALHHRIILSPHAAKRVRDMLVRLIEEHEARYGTLDG